MNSYQKLKIKIEEQKAEIRSLNYRIQELVTNPDSAESLAIKGFTLLRSKLEESCIYGNINSDLSGNGIYEAIKNNASDAMETTSMHPDSARQLFKDTLES